MRRHYRRSWPRYAISFRAAPASKYTFFYDGHMHEEIELYGRRFRDASARDMPPAAASERLPIAPFRSHAEAVTRGDYCDGDIYRQFRRARLLMRFSSLQLASIISGQ